MSVDRWCVLMCVYVFLCLLMCADMMYADVCWCADVCLYVCLCVLGVLKCADVCWCLLICVDVYWCVLMCVDVCWCVLMCADVCWCVLMCVDACWLKSIFCAPEQRNILLKCPPPSRQQQECCIVCWFCLLVCWGTAFYRVLMPVEMCSCVLLCIEVRCVFVDACILYACVVLMCVVCGVLAQACSIHMTVLGHCCVVCFELSCVDVCWSWSTWCVLMCVDSPRYINTTASKSFLLLWSPQSLHKVSREKFLCLLFKWVINRFYLTG